MKKRKTPELLSPAGGMEQLKAAVQNGADAVYMGGPAFNARAKADNFTKEDMEEAIDYAHLRNVKVYITMNTLIKDSELFKAFSYANFFYGIGVDALIVQDLGLARLIRNYLPDFPMHLSTQGTLYNKWAVETVRELGFKRIIPARELSLEEIKELAEECHKEKPSGNKGKNCQVEVFAHGALCMCYSGQCQMSRVLGGINGRSGNRGLCAQPCRLPYTDDKGKTSYILSPKDICTLEHIPQLAMAGVDSLKIEGRLKSPEYVAVVTSIYRKYLDMYGEEGYVKVKASDMERLLQIFNRGGFTTGYLFGNPGKSLLSGESPKNSGIFLGKVRAVKKSSTLIDIDTDRQLGIGDGVEIRGETVTGNVLSYCKENANGSFRIGDIKGRVSPGDKVYKVTDKALNRDAADSYRDDYRKKIALDIEFTATGGRPCKVVLREGQYTAAAEAPSPPERAEKAPTSEEKIRRQLCKLGNTVFEPGRVDIKTDDDLMLPLSTINHLRREALGRLEEVKLASRRKPLSEEESLEVFRMEELDKELLQEDVRGKYIYGSRGISREDVMGEYETFLPIEVFMERPDLREVTLPYILNVSRGRLDEYVDLHFEEIVRAVRKNGILIGNIGWIKRFRERGIKVYGDYGLNVYNLQSKKALAEIGVETKVYSHELQRSVASGFPLMITEHPIESSYIVDRKGVKYSIVSSCSGDKYLVLLV
ncbi:MAG: U32 family peptidase [Clostridiales bacterium]|nr:U32 family peptidase [Clostridiales bacterium]